MASSPHLTDPEIFLPEIADRREANEFLRRLPALPTVATRLLSLMGKEDTSLKEVGDVVSSDGVLAAEVLRMSNSAMFNVRSEVRTILQALAIMGLERVKGLACTVALRNYLGNVLQIPALKRCWRHNLATAVIADEIATWARLDSGEAYTAAILHDIGRLALITIDPSRYLQILDRVATEGVPLSQLEQYAYGMDHAEAGAWLADIWKLPREVVEAIGHHHEELTRPYFEPVGIVHYACAIADEIGFSVLEHPPVQKSAVENYLAALPAPQRERLSIDVSELQVLIASRVNALEVH
jgi:putative nucleotidyltransferase with HDIG domain